MWNGVATGPVTASPTDLLNANQFYEHALLSDLEPGQVDQYRFIYSAGGDTGLTPVLLSAPHLLGPRATLSRSPPTGTTASRGRRLAASRWKGCASPPVPVSGQRVR